MDPENRLPDSKQGPTDEFGDFFSEKLVSYLRSSLGHFWMVFAFLSFGYMICIDLLFI